MTDTIRKLEQENEHLTQELVISKASLREEMDKVKINEDMSLLGDFVSLSTVGRENRHSKQRSEGPQNLSGGCAASNCRAAGGAAAGADRL